MAENPKLDLETESMADSREIRGLDHDMGELNKQKISISDHVNGFNYSGEKSDSFVVDLESFSHAVERESPANSRITLQRSFSRKGPQRSGEKKPSSGATAMNRDIGSALEMKSSTDHPTPPQQVHHQITVTTAANIGASSTAESVRVLKRSGSRRSSPSWALDPRKILIFFATLSSMGTLLLIYFTLTMSKLKEDGDTVNW